MAMMRLPAKWGGVRGQEPASDRGWPIESSQVDRPADELLDLYGVILIAVPLALFLRWLWP
jgi:hypothetical protein